MKTMLVGKLKTLTIILAVGALLTFGGIWLNGSLAAPVPVPDVEPAEEQASTPAAAADDLRPSVGRPMFRIESTVSLHDAAGNPKTITNPAGRVPLGQPTSFTVEAVMERAGKGQIVKFSWSVEVVRVRGNDVLVNLSLTQKERRSAALVRGQSLDFEDFIVTNAWKEISDPNWPGGDLRFKLKVSFDDSAAQAAPPGNKPRPPAADPRAGNTPAPDQADFTIFKLQHTNAAEAAKMLTELFGAPERRNMSIAVDNQTNSLLLRASRDDRDIVSALLQKLDVPSRPPANAAPGGVGNVKKPTDPSSSRPPADIPLVVAPDSKELSIAISPDGLRLAIGGKNDVFILDTKTGKALARTLVGDEVKAVAFSPDGKLLASGSDKGGVRLYDAVTGKEVRRIETSQKLTRIEFAVDGPTKITVLLITTTEPAVRVWDLATGKLLRVEQKGPPTGNSDAKPKAPANTPKTPPAQQEGKIEKIQPGDPSLAEISIGSDQGLKKNDTLEVYRLDPPMYLGQIRIVDVSPQQAVGRVQRVGSNAPPLRVGDRVTTSISREK